MKAFKLFPFYLILLLSTLMVFISSCNNDEDEVVPLDSETYVLNEVNGSGVSGTATFEQTSNNYTIITVEVSGTSAGNSHPMHIHNNSVAEGGGIAISLTPVDGANGMSVTEVVQLDNGTPITYDQLVDFNGYINIHMSTSEMGVILAQGDIGQNAP